MATKERIAINKEYNLLTVFFDDETKTDELPQTTDSTSFEAVINGAKTVEWNFKSLSIDIDLSRIFVFKDTFPSDAQDFEEFAIADFSAEDQTTINNFINSL